MTTGTGSGKTECFLLPLLYFLLTEPDQVRSTPGIRALLLFPMNALVEDQMPHFSDYAILPSYSFPLYVDELVLYQKPKSEPPRRSLRLQRDRKIALREYFPGRRIEADKWVIQSVGLRKGYDEMALDYCPKCHHISKSSTSGPCKTQGCEGRYLARRIVIPKGGFLGQVLTRSQVVDSALLDLQSSEVIFDPASDPPPPLENKGRFLRVARQSAAQMTDARMRMFRPRPAHDSGLELIESSEVDVSDPRRLSSVCLMLPDAAASRGSPRKSI